MRSTQFNNKNMIDKKKLIEDLLDCVADATDTETQITSLTMAGMLMNEVLDEALTIPSDVERSEQLVSFLRQYQKSCEIMHVNKIDAKNFVEQYKTN